MDGDSTPAASFRQSLGFALQRASKLSSSLTASKLPETVDGRQYAVLATVNWRPLLSQRKLGELLGLKRTVMVTLIDELERWRWVERVADTVDRRAWSLTITPLGRAQCAELRSQVAQADGELVEVLGSRSDRLKELIKQVVGSDFEEIPGVGDSVGLLIGRAHRQHAEQARGALRAVGIDPREFGTLSALDETGATTQQGLADYMRMSAPAMLEIVETLNTRDLIMRRRNPSNRRANEVTLTEHGSTVLASARQIVQSVSPTDSGLRRSEVAELASMLERLSATSEPQ